MFSSIRKKIIFIDSVSQRDERMKIIGDIWAIIDAS